MSPKTTDTLSVVFRFRHISLTVTLIYIAGHILQTSSQSTGHILQTSSQSTAKAPCPSNCVGCIGTNCTSCTARHTLHEGSCVDCGTNCVLCTYEEACTLCDTKYGPVVNTPNCSPCISNCDTCFTSLMYCDSCSLGYGPVQVNRTCGQCSAYCTVKNTCNNYGAGTCDQCDSEYYWTPEKSCGPCASNCMLCNISLAHKCDMCHQGYGLTSNLTCALCPNNCVSCNISNQCSICQQGYGLTPDRTCAPCVQHCNLCNTNITYCDVCSFGYFFYANKTCGLCSEYCTQYKCLQNGAGKCDRCDDGYGLTATNTCAPCAMNCANFGCAVNGAGKCDQCDLGFALAPTNTCAHMTLTASTIHESSGTTNSRITPNIIFEPVTFWTSISTTLATSVLGIDLHVEIADGEDLPCPMLEVGLGLGIPCGIIIIVLLIIVIFLCVQNKSLRKFKRQNQDNRQSHSKDSSASNGTTQLPMTAYQHLDARNSKRQYDVIDRYDTISTTTTENTGHYETPLN